MESTDGVLMGLYVPMGFIIRIQVMTATDFWIGLHGRRLVWVPKVPLSHENS